MRLSADAARSRFNQARVATLGTVDAAARPHLVPITFACCGADAVVFAVDHKPKTTTRLRRLQNLARNPSVSLLAEGWSEDWTQLWWVRVDGTARRLAGDDPRRGAALSALQSRYHQYVERPPTGAMVWIEVTGWTGWSGQA